MTPRSLRGRLIGSMALLLVGGLLMISALHAVEDLHSRIGAIGRFVLGDGLPEPLQDLAVVAPFSLVMLVLIVLVTSWSLRSLLRASREAEAAGPMNRQARIDTRRLPAEIQPLVSAMNRALDRLTVAYETERRFTADAAHEMRTPLAALGLRLQRARRDGAVLDWPAVEAELASMRRLIEGLLDLARKEAVGIPSLALNLTRTIREAAAGIEPLVEQAGRALEVDLETSVWTEGSADDLRDMVRNLAQNALVHGAGRILIRLRTTGAAAVLEVRDEGRGVPAAQRAAVFERFRKGSVATTGSGLGLAIVRAVAEAHRGHVGFVDAPGCVVRVELPLLPRPASPRPVSLAAFARG